MAEEATAVHQREHVVLERKSAGRVAHERGRWAGLEVSADIAVALLTRAHVQRNRPGPDYMILLPEHSSPSGRGERTVSRTRRRTPDSPTLVRCWLGANPPCIQCRSDALHILPRTRPQS